MHFFIVFQLHKMQVGNKKVVNNIIHNDIPSIPNSIRIICPIILFCIIATVFCVFTKMSDLYFHESGKGADYSFAAQR